MTGNESLPPSTSTDDETYGAVARWRATFVPSAGWDEEHRPRPMASSAVTADVRRRRHLAPVAVLMAAGLLGAVLVVGLLPSGTGEGLLPPLASSGGAAQVPASPPEGTDNGPGAFTNPPAPGWVAPVPVSVQPAPSLTSNGILASAQPSSALVSELVNPVQTAPLSNSTPMAASAQPATVAARQALDPAFFPLAPTQPAFPALPPFPSLAPPAPPVPFPVMGPPAPPAVFPVMAPPPPPAPFPLPRPH